MNNVARRRSKFVLVGALVASVAIVGGASAVASGEGSPDDIAKAKGVAPVDLTDPAIVLQRREQRFEDDLAALIDQDSSVFAGQRVTGNTHVVYVKQGADIASATQRVDAVAETWGMQADAASVATAPKSEAELIDLHSRVDALLDELKTAGADICGTGPDVVLGKIQVDIEAGQAAAEKVLGDLADSVHFVPCHTTGSPDHGALTTGRYSDFPPWYGGDGIYMAGGGYCTAGFPVTKNGIRYMLISGHCVEINGINVSAAVNGVNGTWPTGYYSGSSSTYMGHSSQTEFSTNLDSSLISGSYGSRIWIGSTSTTTAWEVDTSTATEVVGNPVCHGGAVSGQQCGYTINISPYTWHYESTTCGVKDSYLYNMAKAIGNSSGLQGGDSGAAVYHRKTSTTDAVVVHGTVSGNGCNTDLVYEPFYRTDAVFAGGGLSVP
ncbi:MAG: hypothetical protein ABI542_12130 [Gemmatimonadota bacterium]